MSSAKPTVIKVDGLWLVRLAKDNGKVQEYRCATESQARQLAMVLLSRETPPAVV